PVDGGAGERDLDGDGAVERFVPAPEDDPHGAAADLAEEIVAHGKGAQGFLARADRFGRGREGLHTSTLAGRPTGCQVSGRRAAGLMPANWVTTAGMNTGARGHRRHGLPNTESSICSFGSISLSSASTNCLPLRLMTSAGRAMYFRMAHLHEAQDTGSRE